MGDLRLFPDPHLRVTCQPVTSFGAPLRAVADQMLEVMYDGYGRGLAAPQLGGDAVDLRLFVMDAGWKETGDRAGRVFVNPGIVWSSDEMTVFEEGCLSIPDQFGMVTRPAEVRVGFLDRDGNPQEREFDGLWATCVQHEIDHLNGKLFIDYLGSVRRQMITQKMQKLKRERARG